MCFNDFPVFCLGACLSTPNSQKKGYGRPKSAEPGSPLLRRALSPDRLHPRSAESKTSISPLVNTVAKVTPRVTIAQSSHNNSEISDESGVNFKESNESVKGEKKVPSEQKADYSKLTHGISINLGNVGISNSCGSTQLPRIAEEKDSPTGTKSDDYSSSKEIGPEKSEKQSIYCGSDQSVERAQSNVRQSKTVDGSKISQYKKKEENTIQLSVSQASTQQITSVTNLQKNLDQKHYQGDEKSTAPSHKSFVVEQKTTGKGNMEAHQDGKKMLKRYKADIGDSAHSSMHESSAASGREKKNN